MGAARALLHSYSMLVRDRARTTTAKGQHHVPRGMFSSHPRCCLPRRSGLGLVPSGQVEVRGERVVARAFSLGKAASVILSAGSVAADISEEAGSPMAGAIARIALQGLSSGLINGLDAADPFIMDLGAGLVGQVANHGATRVQKYASDELKESGGALGGKEQLVRLAAYCAFVDTPIMHWWQDWLDQVVMPHDPTGPLAVALKVLLDQGLMAPLATILMLTTLKILEGKSDEALPYAKQKFLDKLLPDYAVWPVARVVEFAFVPQAQQPIFEGLVSITSAAFQLIRHNHKKQEQAQQQAEESDVKQQQDTSAHSQSDSLQRASSTQSPRPTVLHPNLLHHHEQHHHYRHPTSSLTMHGSHGPSPLSRSSLSRPEQSADDAGIHVWQGMRAVSPFATHAQTPLDSPRSVTDSIRSMLSSNASSDVHGHAQLAFST